jgi:hypothetical protein
MKMILVPALAAAVSSTALAQQSIAADRAAVEAVLSN